MTTSLLSTYADLKYAAFWIWIEILAIVTISLLLIVRFICGRIIPGKSLKGSNVLVTNGNSKLSQELCRQLVKNHHCNVAIIDCCNSTLPTWSSKTFKCDLLNHENVKHLAQRLQEEFGNIDILMDTSCLSQEKDHQPQLDFVQQTSNSIMSFMNLYVNFIPTMLEHGGRIVTFKNTRSSAQVFMETTEELNDLVKTVLMNSSATATNALQNISLSMVFYNEEGANSHSTANKLELNNIKIAERILKGIRAEETLIQVKVESNFIEYYSKRILHTFKIALTKIFYREPLSSPTDDIKT